MLRAILASFVLLALACPFILADVGPSFDTEPYAYVSLNATYAGAPVPSDTSVTIICYYNGSPNYAPTTSFGCENGICNSTGFYKLAPCRHGGDAAFEFRGQSLPYNYTTQVVQIKGGETSMFNVQLNPDGSSKTTFTGYAPVSACVPAILLFTIIGVSIAFLKGA